MLINFHNGGLISATIAVIWGGENRDNVSILRPIISFHYQLVRSCDQRQPVVVIKGLGNILPECVSCASWRNAPATPVIWIAPEQIAHGSFMRDFLDTVERADVIKGVDGWAETSVEAENLILNEGCEGEEIEEVRKILPDIGVAVFSQTLIVESIDLCDLARLVISTKNGDSLRVSNFEAN